MKFKKKIEKVYSVFPQMGQLADMAVGDQKLFARKMCPSRTILDKEIKKRFDQDSKRFEVFYGTKGVLIRRTA